MTLKYSLAENILCIVVVVFLLPAKICVVHTEDADVSSTSDNGGATPVRSTFTCPRDGIPVFVAACLAGCKRGDKVETFPYDQRSRYDGCNTCSTRVYRYPDSTICEGIEMCTMKACLPISSMLPGSEKEVDSDDDTS